MEERLQKLYKQCINELKLINLDFMDEEKFGKIDIKFARKNAKRYGCCKQENPDKSTIYRKNRKIYYRKFNKHIIEISQWLMELNEDIIKNTIIHELIHCIPDCNNHGSEFKYYAKLVNEKLGYNITRLGDKQKDYEKSNLIFKPEERKIKYKIICKKCGQIYYRQRIDKKITRKYVCGRCKGKLEVYEFN